MTLQQTGRPASAPVTTDPYDEVVLLSFGGPEAPDEVMPFLENVTRGRGIPHERLAAVAEHYLARGGRSPINDLNRALLAALRAELASRGASVPVRWGNRNWAPYLTDVLRDAHRDGARRVLVLATSAYASYSGCRQYREDVAAALATLDGEGRALHVDKVRHLFDLPGFVEASTDAVTASLTDLDVDDAGTRLVFVTHSIPTAMARTSGPGGDDYVRQHEQVAALVAAGVHRATGRAPGWDLVYCSRSGPPQQPWLEPDVDDHLAALAGRGVRAVVLVPIGFVSDHMEVVHDLDTQAAAVAREHGLVFRRAATAGTHPAFVRDLAGAILDRAALERGEDPVRVTVGDLPPGPDACPADCCPNLRDPGRPAACGADGTGGAR